MDEKRGFGGRGLRKDIIHTHSHKHGMHGLSEIVLRGRPILTRRLLLGNQ